MVQEAYVNGERRVQPYMWHSHANILAETLRKPDVVLIPQNQQLKPHCNFRAIQTYCEVKYKDKDDLLDEALIQITKVSGHVSAMQLCRCRDSYVSVLIFHLFYLSPDCLTVIHSLRTPY